MKLTQYLILVVLVVTTYIPQDSDKAAPLVVVKFNSGIYREPSNVVRSVHDPDPMNEPIRSFPVPPRNETLEAKNRRELNERRMELRGAEMNAVRSANKGMRTYFYHLEIKNISIKKIKNFAWEYQSTGASDPSDRQFYCAMNIKPNDKKALDLLSPLAPSRVVNAAAAQQLEKDSAGLVVINLVEYIDGSVWVRPGWKQETFSVGELQKLEAGQCVGL